MAKSNTTGFHNIKLVEGDGFRLPFPSCTFDIVKTRLADYSQKETYRVLRRRGYFFEYSLGQDADKEISSKSEWLVCSTILESFKHAKTGNTIESNGTIPAFHTLIGIVL